MDWWNMPRAAITRVKAVAKFVGQAWRRHPGSAGQLKTYGWWPTAPMYGAERAPPLCLAGGASIQRSSKNRTGAVAMVVERRGVSIEHELFGLAQRCASSGIM